MSPFCVTSLLVYCSDFVNVIRGFHGCAYTTYFVTGCDAVLFGRQVSEKLATSVIFKWANPAKFPILLLLIKRYNLYKVLACSTAFFQLSLFCTIFFHLCTFIFLISSKTSFSQRVLGLPIGLLDMGFHLLIF
jgi:hypothetical protein